MPANSRYTRFTVQDEQAAKNVAIKLIGNSIYFECEPLPEEYFTFYVKTCDADIAKRTALSFNVVPLCVSESDAT